MLIDPLEVLAGEQMCATDHIDEKRMSTDKSEKGEGSDYAEPSLEGPVG